MKVRVSRKARSDLLDAYGYLATRNPAAAERLVAEFDAKVRQLAQFPLIGRARPNLGTSSEAFWCGTMSFCISSTKAS